MNPGFPTRFHDENKWNRWRPRGRLRQPGSGLQHIPRDRASELPSNRVSHPLDIAQLSDSNREDIKYCQAKGKTILLSIGGATYDEGGLPSADAAVSAAQVVWDAFGPVKTGSSTPRPFGDAVIDGFDLDFESPVSNMVPFANALRRLMDGGESRVPTSKRNAAKKHFLTAALQFVFPDAANQEMLNGAVFFDAIWVQFYNNFCGLNSFIPDSGAQNAFNFDLWDGWAKSLSRNRNVKVFIGMPGSPGAAGSGFVAPNIMQQVLQWSKAFSSLGGIMVWDASQAYENRGMLDGLKQDLLH